MRAFTLLIILLSILTISCSKTIKCDNAQICVVNTGNDTIYYCWGCNQPSEILLPNQKVCIDTGPLEIKESEKFTSVFYFDYNKTPSAGVRGLLIKLNDCYIEKHVD